METRDWIMSIAVLLAPLVALQVQKLIENWKELRQRKRWVYLTLMTTRHAQLSLEHVRALNMIDLEFTGKSRKQASVRRAWKAYLDILATVPTEDDNAGMAVWAQRKLELFTELLSVMGECVGYKFDPVHIQKGIYAPRGHFSDEQEQRATRRLLLELLIGNRPLKIHTSLVPLDEEAGIQGKKFIQTVQDVYEGKRALSVSITKQEGSETSEK